METSILENEIAKISGEVATTNDDAKKFLKIENQEDLKNATEFISLVKAKIKRVEEMRQFFVKPLNDQVKKINELFKTNLAPLEAVEASVKRTISDFTLAEIQKARDEEARLLKLREKQNEKREEKGQAPILTPIQAVERPQTTVKSDAGKITTKLVWKFNVIDPLKLPLSYKRQILTLALEKGIVDSVIRRAIQNGERSIEGVQIYEDVDTSITAKR